MCGFMLLASQQFETTNFIKNWDNNIQNFHLGKYIVGYTVGNHVLRLHLSVAVKLNFGPYIRRYTSPNDIFGLNIFYLINHFYIGTISKK